MKAKTKKRLYLLILLMIVLYVIYAAYEANYLSLVYIAPFIRPVLIFAELIVCVWVTVIIFYRNIKRPVTLGWSKIGKLLIATAGICLVFSWLFSIVFLKINIVEYVVPNHAPTESMEDTVDTLNTYDFSNGKLNSLTITQLQELAAQADELKIEYAAAREKMDDYVASVLSPYENPLAVIPPPHEDVKKFIPISSADLLLRALIIPFSVLCLLALILLAAMRVNFYIRFNRAKKGLTLKCVFAAPKILKNHRYIFVFAKYNGKWLLRKNNETGSWEVINGAIEKKERPLEAARRELNESFESIEFELNHEFDFQADLEPCGMKNGKWTNGAVYSASVLSVENADCFDELPPNLAYPELTHAILNYFKGRGI